MKIIIRGRCVMIIFCLAISWSMIHAMNPENDQQYLRRHLNVSRFLDNMKRKFSITDHHVDFITLQSVLLQYHPNEYGNIIGKNLKKLRAMADRACLYWDHKQLYYQMLQQVCLSIDNYFLLPMGGAGDEDENDNELEVCPICKGGLKEAITLPCEHVFCYECLFQWYVQHKAKNDSHSQCPSCRASLQEHVKLNFKNHQNYKKDRAKACDKANQETQQALAEDEALADQLQLEDYEEMDESGDDSDYSDADTNSSQESDDALCCLF